MTYKCRVAFILSLINQPRKVMLSREAGPRQHRRRVEAVTGKAAQAWTNVGWPVGSPVFRRDGVLTTEGSRKALHWCRRYLAPAIKGEPKAEWIDGRWQRWVRDCWRGHPAFGIKLQDHMPRLPGHKAGDKGDMLAILPQTKLDALSGAQRAALVASGHVASATLH